MISFSVRPQLTQMTLMPAFLQAGTAFILNCSTASCPGPFVFPNAGLRKKFCMSITINADFAGSTVMGSEAVSMLTLGCTGGES